MILLKTTPAVNTLSFLTAFPPRVGGQSLQRDYTSDPAVFFGKPATGTGEGATTLVDSAY